MLIHETDSDRRQTLLRSEQNEDLQGLKSGTLWDFFQRDFITGRQGASHVTEMPDDHDTRYVENDTSKPSISGGKRKHDSEEVEGDLHHLHFCRLTELFPTERPRTGKVVRSAATSLGIGKLVQSEIDLRKKESLGMAPVKGGGRTLGTGTSHICTGSSHNVARTHAQTPSPEWWACLVCTLYAH